MGPEALAEGIMVLVEGSPLPRSSSPGSTEILSAKSIFLPCSEESADGDEGAVTDDTEPPNDTTGGSEPPPGPEEDAEGDGNQESEELPTGNDNDVDDSPGTVDTSVELEGAVTKVVENEGEVVSLEIGGTVILLDESTEIYDGEYRVLAREVLAPGVTVVVHGVWQASGMVVARWIEVAN